MFFNGIFAFTELQSKRRPGYMGIFLYQFQELFFGRGFLGGAGDCDPESFLEFLKKRTGKIIAGKGF